MSQAAGSGPDPRLFSADSLAGFSASILEKVGIAPSDAEIIARCLVEANMRGVDGHGVMRLVQYVESIEAGGINLHPDVRVVRESGATAVIDADGGYGFAPSQEAMDLAVSLAKNSGIGCVAVANSHHSGMALPYVRRASEAGCVGIAISNSTAVMPAPGGLEAVVGNDPIAIAVPREGSAPLVADLALSRVSWGKIGVALERGEEIPAGWALDRSGRDTTDPQEALLANLLVPIGGAKGFALALLFELLSSGLSGSPVGPAADTHGNPAGGCGHLMIALEPEAFGGRGQFMARVEELVSAVKGSQTIDDREVRLPGERSEATRAEREAGGVPLDHGLLERLSDLAQRLGVGPL